MPHISYDDILRAVQVAQSGLLLDPQVNPQWVETTDPDPDAPIDPEDAPDGVPPVMLYELPYLPIIIVPEPEIGDDE